MTLIYEPELKILKLYLQTKMNFLALQMDKQTDVIKNITMTHLWVVII